MGVLLGFGALTIDVGVMYNVRADLQRSADAAALAGAAAYTSDKMLQIRQGGDGNPGAARCDRAHVVTAPAGER